ncbi:MAG: hypothetical protein H7A32_04670 [Deltaproteobacteria bacterium]|nr:hypothetical protein [Deltaproteobacteria bacterium]
MMFQADTAFAVELLALVAGTALLIFAGRENVCCKAFAKIVGYFTIVAAILAMLCTFYYTVRYWEEGHFSHPYSATTIHPHQGLGMGQKGMMKEMVQNCPMMQKKGGMMMDQKKQSQPEKNNATEEDHSQHH